MIGLSYDAPGCLRESLYRSLFTSNTGGRQPLLHRLDAVECDL